MDDDKWQIDILYGSKKFIERYEREMVHVKDNMPLFNVKGSSSVESLHYGLYFVINSSPDWCTNLL